MLKLKKSVLTHEQAGITKDQGKLQQEKTKSLPYENSYIKRKSE